MQLPSDHVAAIQRWASKTVQITRLYLFGSRAKGTACAASDVDLAIEIDAETEKEAKRIYDINWLTWCAEIEEAIDDFAGVDLLLLRSETPITKKAVEEAGIVLFDRATERDDGTGARQ